MAKFSEKNSQVSSRLYVYASLSQDIDGKNPIYVTKLQQLQTMWVEMGRNTTWIQTELASIPKERIQVYFIDSEEYFKRKATLTDEDGNLFPDNDERSIFFAKGVIETVKKLNWAPDIIHVHGWLASLLPLYLKEYYKDEPLFANSKIVTSLYNQSFDDTLNTEMINKIKFDNISAGTFSLNAPTWILNLTISESIGFFDGVEETSRFSLNFFFISKPKKSAIYISSNNIRREFNPSFYYIYTPNYDVVSDSQY